MRCYTHIILQGKIVFDDWKLHEDLVRGIEKLELTEPTPVQKEAVPLALDGKDLLVSAKTGSGKTLAFLLPTLHKLLTTPDKKLGTRALILVPTRELAIQIKKDCIGVGSYTQLKFGVIIGGEKRPVQRALLRKNPEVLIATPGRLLELIDQGATYLDSLEVLILDEADRMLDMGFSDDVLRIISACNSERQTMLFSATLTHAKVQAIASDALISPQTIKLSNVRETHDDIVQQKILADDNDHKTELLVHLLENDPYKLALVFVNKRISAEALGTTLRHRDIRTAFLHGELLQAQRSQIIHKLRKGIVTVLVATDVAARGLDVEGIDLVVNYDVPRNATDYVHRIGRTGRAAQTGTAITLVNHHEWNVIGGIERYLRSNFEKRALPGLKATFGGLKRTKTKSALEKKNKGKKRVVDKSSLRLRNKKQIGKRRQPTNPAFTAKKESSQSATDGATKPEATTPAVSGGWDRLKRKKPENKE